MTIKSDNSFFGKIKKAGFKCPQTIYKRIYHGWTIEEALNTPLIPNTGEYRNGKPMKYGDTVYKFDKNTYRRIVYAVHKGVSLRTAIKLCTENKYLRYADYAE